MRQYRLTEQASEDLIAIYVQGHDQFGIRQADRYQDDLTEVFETLALYPEMARLRLEFDPPAHIYPHRSHVIVYERETDGIVIIRVRHGHEDWQGDP